LHGIEGKGTALEFSALCKPLDPAKIVVTRPDTVVPVSELNRQVRLSLEREFPLLWIAGEVSNLTRASSGHLYFSLKDESAQARCVMFRSRAQAIPWRLENGQQVEVRALVSLYEPRGEFQLAVEGMRRAGLGRLFEAFARLRESLETEGLFAAARKQAVPRFPRAIGIVSSPQAAALRDVIAAVGRRAPHLPTILYPTAVQGSGAAATIAEAIRTATARKECDLLLVVRGGGSIEDLWAFNEEIVARALAACPLPTISGIGHETDVTIADFVADLRAATPTAAAELATQGWYEATSELRELGDALSRAANYRLAIAQQSVDRLAMRLIHPATRLGMAAESLNVLATRLKASIAEVLGKRRVRLGTNALALLRRTPRADALDAAVSLLSQRLEASLRRQQASRLGALERIAGALGHLNPEAILARGFAVVYDQNGNLVSAASTLAVGQAIHLRLADGEVDASVLATRPG
jgi:exodeoxyribonuclease VII large subunit